jgi:hypothetical protein
MVQASPLPYLFESAPFCLFSTKSETAHRCSMVLRNKFDWLNNHIVTRYILSTGCTLQRVSVALEWRHPSRKSRESVLAAFASNFPSCDATRESQPRLLKGGIWTFAG